MKNEIKELIAEKMIEAAKGETQDLSEIQKALSYAYNLIRTERKNKQVK